MDLVVVDQMRGPMSRCDWLDFGKVSIAGNQISAARLKGSGSNQLFTPDGWQFEGSMSQHYGFVPVGAEGKSLKFLRRENDIDVYLNMMTGEEVFIGRTSGRED